MMINKALQTLFTGRDLDGDRMSACMHEIMTGAATDAQIAAFLTALKMKGETVQEITAAARVMRAHARSIPVSKRSRLVDIVGTGGDMANTFNISTTAAFVACGAGLTIAKHGNRAASSRCGSADVVEALGINISISPEQTAACVDRIGLGFLFARTLHPAMKHAAPARSQIEISTIFNLLGPLTNPADADYLVLGVYDPRLTEMMAGVAGALGRKRALVVHGMDGLDEISICGPTRISEYADGTITTTIFKPDEIGLQPSNPREISGGDARENASIVLDILQGARGSRRDIVCLNAAAALLVSGMAPDFATAFRHSCKSIDSGAALEKLQKLKKLTARM